MEDEWRKYRCDNCTRRFGIEEYLKIHKLVSHSKETSNVCNMCEKEFPASRALEEHMIYHIKKNSKQLALSFQLTLSHFSGEVAEASGPGM